MKARSAQPYPCGSCPAAGADLGDLETHIVNDAPGHRPANPEHMTPRMEAAIAAHEAKAAVRTKLAEAVGVTVDELRSALRGW